MASIEEMEARLKELEAYEAIRNTIADYLFFMDQPGTAEDIIGLFTEDAILEISGYGEAIEGTLEGRDAIAGLYRGIKPPDGPPGPGKHITTNLRIKLEGEKEAVATQYLAIGGDATEKGPGGGIYQERLRREADGRWRFTKKRIITTVERTVTEAFASPF